MSDSDPSDIADGATRPRRAPTLASYAALNLALWLYLVFQTWLLSTLLGSSRVMILFALLLAAGFLLASVFDYAWLLSRRK